MRRRRTTGARDVGQGSLCEMGNDGDSGSCTWKKSGGWSGVFAMKNEVGKGSLASVAGTDECPRAEKGEEGRYGCGDGDGWGSRSCGPTRSFPGQNPPDIHTHPPSLPPRLITTTTTRQSSSRRSSPHHQRSKPPPPDENTDLHSSTSRTLRGRFPHSCDPSPAPALDGECVTRDVANSFNNQTGGRTRVRGLGGGGGSYLRHTDRPGVGLLAASSAVEVVMRKRSTGA